jgi:hypothetical protein
MTILLHVSQIARPMQSISMHNLIGQLVIKEKTEDEGASQILSLFGNVRCFSTFFGSLTFVYI